MNMKEKGIYMSMYRSKLLEILAIERNANKSYLHTKLSFNETIEILLEVDDETAANLLAVTSFEGKDKYRLSLHSFWDSAQKKYMSYITKTYLDQSERIYFSCSEEYVNHIDSIKTSKQITDLLELPYICIYKESLEQLQKAPSQEMKQEEKESSRFIFRFSWGKFALISVTVMILFGFKFSNVTYVNTLEENENVTVNAESVDKVVPDSPEKEEIDSQPDIDPSLQTNLPFIELSEETTYSLPEGTVALTFDDGPSIYSKEIVNILKEYQVGGTFFHIGINANKHKEAVQYVKENGYSIGNHSMTHKQMTKLDYVQQEREIMNTSQLIEDITLENVRLFRPPYGALDETTIDLINTYDKKIVLWNNDPQDWKHQNSDVIFNNIVNAETSGAIILLHESQVVIDALPRIIEYLQGQNLKIVSLK